MPRGDQGRARRPAGASSPPRATCARARSARRPRSTASSARSPTCSPSTRSRPCRRATSRPRPSPTRRGSPPRTWPRRAASPATAARRARSAASTSTRGPGGKQARVEYENVFALGPLCGVSDPDAVLEASAPLRRARPRHDLRRRHASRGRWSARSAASSTRRGCASATPTRCCARSSEIGAREGLGALLAEGSRRGRRDRRPGLGRLRPARQGPRAARLRAAHAAGDGARAGRQRARRRPQPLGRLRGRPLRRRTTASTGGAAARRGGDRDRGPRRGHGLAHPVQVPARRVRAIRSRSGRALLGSVTGWDVDGDELEATARRIVLAKRAFNAREGWTRADDGLPDRFLEEPLEVGSGRTATLTRERLDAMIDGVLRGAGIAGVGPARRGSGRGPLPQGGWSSIRSIRTGHRPARPIEEILRHSGHRDARSHRDQDRQPDDRRSRDDRPRGDDDLAGGEGRGHRDPRSLP